MAGRSRTGRRQRPCLLESLEGRRLLAAQFMVDLYPEGEGPDFVAGDRLTLAGSAPTNLDGGLQSHSWIGTGQLTLKIIECARQLRGTCGPRQVAGAQLALATNAGSGARHIEMALLARA